MSAEPSLEPSVGAPRQRSVGGGGEDEVTVLVRRLDPEVALPVYALDGDAGADVVTTVDIVLAPGERAVVPTGLAIALPAGYAAFVHPRSGLAARLGLGLVNAPGTIDAGYRGEIKVIAVNLDPVTPVALARGDRIAQLVVQRVSRARWAEVEQLPDSERGAAGHGSTGGSATVLRPNLAPDLLGHGPGAEPSTSPRATGAASTRQGQP